MKKIDEKLICFMETNGAVSKEDREIYEYALKSVWIIGGNIITSLVIGFGMKAPWYCILLLLALIPLRSDAGGYHARTAWRCYFMSCAGLVLAVLWIKADLLCQTAVTVCMAVPSFFLILRHAPLEAPNKPLDGERQRTVGKRARVIVTVEMTAGIMCFFFDKRAAIAILCAVIWCTLGYIGWFLEKKCKRAGM